jgi:hypothetical protein
MRKALVVVAAVVASAVACGAFELSELGIRGSLNLRPLRNEGRVRWIVSVGVYARAVLNDAWSTRAAVGLLPTSLSPYGQIGLARTLTDFAWLEADLTLDSMPDVGPAASVRFGGRFVTKIEPSIRLEISSLSFHWSWPMLNAQLGDAFSFRPNLTLHGTLFTPAGGLIGQAATITVMERPSGSDPPAVSLGGGLILAGELAFSVGAVP